MSATSNSPDTDSGELTLIYLPGYAQFLLDHHLEELAAEFIRLFREVNLPMLAFFESMPEDQLLELSKKTTAHLLTAFVKNRAVENIVATVNRWSQDQLPNIGRNQIATNDIGAVSYVRKQALTSFLTRYSADPQVIIQVVREIDRYVLELQNRMIAQYISVLNEHLNQQLHFTEKITDTAPAIIATFNAHTGKYLFISQGFEVLLGFSPERVLDEGIGFLMNLIHPDDLVKLMDENARALEKVNRLPMGADEVQVSEFRYRIRHQNGNYRWFQTYGTVFDRNSEGKVEHILNISLDITDQVDAEHQAQDKKRQLEQSNASLQEFAYIASHDLKEPLRKITAFGDRLLQNQGTKMDEEGQLYLSKIIDAAQRMHEMIGDVLSVSLISSDQTFGKHSLQRLLEEVLQALEHQIEQVNADIQSDQLPEVMVVASQFRQLFLNLLTNAFKFARKENPPVVRITHRFLQPAEIAQPGLTPARRYLELKIADNGIGFDNRYANKIFAIFQRLHAKKEFEGTGIGLAICRKIVENHGGIISASGIPNQGATFTIVIPG
ncbi:sensor histidine kinase [Larkinella terrae]|uniref:histidine kinase n=1 Tax=Larkinella terrae TaxID=2025311 RepID=A0A7K0ESZ1_9BACT|nr:PAS domain-containing sensor histidine kinase [Larkinella terrae]MRS64927.1 PAS domain-containing protein [Larkinella terrae]